MIRYELTNEDYEIIEEKTRKVFIDFLLEASESEIDIMNEVALKDFIKGVVEHYYRVRNTLWKNSLNEGGTKY